MEHGTLHIRRALARLRAEHGACLQDARYGVRMLASSPGFTFAAVTCLAIGIGLPAAIYSELRSTVFRPLPGARQVQDLVRLLRPVAFANYEEFRDHSGQFSSVAAYMGQVPIVVSDRGSEPQRVWAHIATPNYFEVLGAKAELGRVFGSEERIEGSAESVILSERLWRTRFGGDTAIVGRSIRINGAPVTVIGVAETDFLGASPTTSAADVWIPTTAKARIAPELAGITDRHIAAFDVIGRLRPGLTYAPAEQALDALQRRLEQIHNDPGKDSKERRVRLLPGGRMFPIRDEDLPRAMGFPLLLVALVLLMACSNVANMLVARGAGRRREIAVRLSLGAAPGRILRQVLTESLLLAVLGCVGGILFAFLFLKWLNTTRPMIPTYVYFDLRFDWSSFVFVVAVAAGCGLLFGLAPALRASRVDIYTGMKPYGAAGLHARPWFSLRNVLVFQQVVASMVLLLLTGFVVVGWQRAANRDVGYETARLYLLSIDPVRDGYTPERARDFFDRLPQRLRRVPGVEAVSLAQSLPLAMLSSEMMMSAKVDFAQGTRALGAIRADRVGAGFFQTVGTPLLRGREFTEHDETEEARELIVNETMARQVWPGEDPLGRPVDLEGNTWQVIGVVRDIRSAFPLAPTQPAVYRPVTPSGYALPSAHGVTVAVRVIPGFDSNRLLRREIAAIDAQLTVLEVKHMSDEVEQTLYLARFASFLYAGMGLFGLVLASVGLGSVTAYAVARRTHEIGIRLALGAGRDDVLRLILREGSAIVAAGTVVGLAGALAATRAAAAFVETLAEATRTTVTDPFLLLGAPALLATLALAACYVPAHRAMQIDPVTALRDE
ncbi:MAG TPA: ABC transporter permease [Bryobacteraceae bacterium]|nr:ABC transporter permease [Bryobacteraceae bacterium]